MRHGRAMRSSSPAIPAVFFMQTNFLRVAGPQEADVVQGFVQGEVYFTRVSPTTPLSWCLRLLQTAHYGLSPDVPERLSVLRRLPVAIKICEEHARDHKNCDSRRSQFGHKPG
jgi:hypothetical protein